MDKMNRGEPIGPARFLLAVQALVVMGKSGGVHPSAAIASQCHSHATFLRRVLAPILQAGIVAAREGRDGGYYLTRPMEQISLAEIYLAVTPPPDPAECVGDHEAAETDMGLGMALKEVWLQAEEQVIATLRRHTLANLVQRADALDRATR